MLLVTGCFRDLPKGLDASKGDVFGDGDGESAGQIPSPWFEDAGFADGGWDFSDDDLTSACAQPRTPDGAECRSDGDCAQRLCRHGTCVTPVPASLTENTLWREQDGPYLLEGDTLVAATLRIEPGVRVFGESHALAVVGQLQALGSAERPVTFYDVDLTGDGEASSAAQISIAFARIEGGSLLNPLSFQDVTPAIVLEDSTVRCTRRPAFLSPARGASAFRRNDFASSFGFGLLIGDASVEFTNNRFASMRGTLEQPAIITVYFMSESGLTVHKNTFADRGALVLAFEVTLGGESEELNAAENDWSTTDTAEVGRMVHDAADDPALATRVVVEPLLEGPDPATPSAAP
jgi:hypothetical protein